MSRARNFRTGQNEPCPCGSRKKFKRCCGSIEEPKRPPGPPQEWIEAQLAKHKANEARRQSQQGLGKPIIGTKFKGYQMVAVGNTVHWGKWKTFFEFLENYIRTKLDVTWGNAELKKPIDERHPIMRWYELKTRYMNKQIKEQGKVHTAPMTGAVAAYYSLAYNLYLLEHNAELQRRLLGRLKHPDQFRGAYYEAFVAALFILAGFELALENERDGDTTHCEFTARSTKTGKSYSVEAKSRGPNKANLDVGNQLSAALGKVAAHDRVVFIDVNVPDDMVAEREKLLDAVVDPIKTREPKLTIKGQPAPAACVIVTNHPYHYDLDDTSTSRAAVAVGFKVDDFGVRAQFTSLVAAHKAKEKHADLFRIMDALREYHIPSTFDGEVPQFAFGEAERRFTVGETYQLDEIEPGAVGVLTSGAVVPSKKMAHLTFSLSNGSNIIAGVDLTDAEVEAYRAHPETFFGVDLKVGRNLGKDPFELFEFLYENYKATPREKILQWFAKASDLEELKKLSDDELRLVYCERHVWAVVQMSEKNK